MTAILQITDGITTVDLLNTAGLSMYSWQPQIADYKDGGVFQENKTSEGRRPVMGVYGNVVETINLAVSGASQDEVKTTLQSLQALLNNAFNYFIPGSIQSSPVYIVAKSNRETNTRYGVIYKGTLTGYSDLYFDSFESGIIVGGTARNSGFMELTLTLERGHWQSEAPGDATGLTSTSEVETTSWIWEINSSVPANLTTSIIKLANGDLLAGNIGNQIIHSIDNGTTWSQVLSGSPSVSTVNCLCQAANGSIYAGTGSSTGGGIIRSTNNGSSWSLNYSTNVDFIYSIIQLANGDLLAGGKATGLAGRKGIWRSTNNGTSWTNVLANDGGTLSDHITHIMQDSDDNVWAVDALGDGEANVWFSDDNGATWSINFTSTNDFLTCIRQFSDGNLYFVSRLSTDLFSSLWWSSDSGATWTKKSNFSNDYTVNVIELADNTLIACGANFAVSRKMIWTSTDFGFSWVTFTWSVGATQAQSFPNGLFQNDDDLVYSGDSTNIIVGHTETVITTGEGITNNYTSVSTTFPFISIANDQVLGDIPALGRIRATSTVNHANRLFVSLRSFDRGEDFTPYLNLSDENNLTGVSAQIDDNQATFVTEGTAPTGVATLFNPSDETSMTTVVKIVISPTITSNFYGTYRAFLRVHMVAGAIGDIGVRLQVATGSGGITNNTDIKYPTPDTTNFEVLDFGQISMPSASIFRPDELADVTEIRVQASSMSGTPSLYLYDIIIMPTDEWSGDYIDKANEDDSDVGDSNSIPKLLDIDSVTDPRNPIRAVVRRVDSDSITSRYKAVGNKVILKPAVTQRLWFFAMQTSQNGTVYTWIAPPNISFTTQVSAVFRYLLLRGGV